MMLMLSLLLLILCMLAVGFDKMLNNRGYSDVVFNTNTHSHNEKKKRNNKMHSKSRMNKKKKKWRKEWLWFGCLLLYCNRTKMILAVWVLFFIFKCNCFSPFYYNHDNNNNNVMDTYTYYHSTAHITWYTTWNIKKMYVHIETVRYDEYSIWTAL